MSVIEVTRAQITNAEAVMVEAMKIGQADTRAHVGGDYTEVGLLVKLFEVLDIHPLVVDEQHVGKET